MIPDPPVFAPKILAQVVALLKVEETERLLRILRAQIVALSEMDDETIDGAEGRALLHRLTSEAGMLGFRRLSTVCTILDDGPDHRSAGHLTWARAELHPVLERSHQEIVRQLDGAMKGGDDERSS